MIKLFLSASFRKQSCLLTEKRLGDHLLSRHIQELVIEWWKNPMAF